MTIVMGILNVTPDSFSDGGRYVAADDAIARGLELRDHGATIVDVGGESTRPGAAAVDPIVEQARVIPVIEGLVAEGVAVSIDTMHADTARAAVAAGASLINDVSGGLADADMARVVAESDVRYVAMHWRGGADAAPDYADVVTDVRDELAARVDALQRVGVDPSRIVLDPGLGFAKNPEHNWALLARLDELTALGHDVLVGASRKRFLGALLAEGAPMEARDQPTAVVSALAARGGAWAVRVHDVPSTLLAVTVADLWAAGGCGVTDRYDEHERMDEIRLTGLRATAHHGVFDHERENGQVFVIDVAVRLPLSPAAATDELDRTVHYGVLAEAVVAAVERDPVDLIETVAERVADVALSFDAVREVEVTVHKPEAPITVPFADVSVTIIRRPPRRLR